MIIPPATDFSEVFILVELRGVFDGSVDCGAVSRQRAESVSMRASTHTSARVTAKGGKVAKRAAAWCTSGQAGAQHSLEARDKAGLLPRRAGFGRAGAWPGIASCVPGIGLLASAVKSEARGWFGWLMGIGGRR